MVRIACRLSLFAALSVASPIALRAGLVTFTPGSAAPSFTDGQTGIGAGTYNAAVAGNPAPFHGFNGSDVAGPNFSAAWAYGYAALSGTIASVTLELGLFDHDSAAAGDQVAAFSLGGIDLAALLNAAFESRGGASGEYNIYTLTLPSSTFAALAAGAPGLSLALQPPGGGVLGPTDFNGAGLDFSKLSITTGDTGTVPEPATWMLLAAGFAALGCGRRLRRG